MRRDEIIRIYRQGEEAVVEAFTRLSDRVDALESYVHELRLHIQELEARLNKDSHNSSKPPSSDKSGTGGTGSTGDDASNSEHPKRKHPNSRPPSDRHPGGQAGHPGHTLQSSSHPDKVIKRDPQLCQQCHASLCDAPVIDTSRRQVFDLPPLQMKVTEYQVSSKECPCCGKLNQADFPKHVLAPVQYGPRLQAIAVYLMNYQLLPLDRSAQLLEDLLGQPISVGSLTSFQSRCYQKLEQIMEQIKEGIIHARVANFDETGFYIDQKRQWLHSASTPFLTYYAAHPGRGKNATQEIGILPQFGGNAVHDDYQSYYGYLCQHSSCNAHHLRELTFIEEQFHQRWATDLKALLCRIKHSVEKAQEQGKDHFSRSTLRKFEQQYHHLLEEGLSLNLPQKAEKRVHQRGRQKQSAAKNLLDRLKKYSQETLRFMVDFSVPFDNNLAERDLRMMKVQQKISGCFRTMSGAEHFCRIRSYISTARKQGVNVLHALQRVFYDHPFVPNCST